MKYVFFGGKEIGSFILDNLIEQGHLPEGIVAYQDIIREEVLHKALLKGVKMLHIKSFKKETSNIANFVCDTGADMIISVAFPFILPQPILDLVRYPINIHSGAIPKYRGAHPLSAALLNDEPYQATTVHIMINEVDAGDVLLQDFIKVNNEDTMVSIRQRLIELSLVLILKVINQIKTDTLYPKSQIGEVIWAPKRVPEDSKIEFSKPSRYLHNFVRALVDPYPNAFAHKEDGELVKIKKSFACNKAGVVLAELGEKQYVISTGDGVLMIETDKYLKMGDQLS